MENPSEKGIRDKLLLEMAVCIAELIKDPYDNSYESDLLSLYDVHQHLLKLGFKDNGVRQYDSGYVHMIDPYEGYWSISSEVYHGGVQLSKDEDEYESDDYEEDEYYEDEGDGKPL